MIHKKLSIILIAVLFSAVCLAVDPPKPVSGVSMKALRPDLIISEISITPTNPYTTDSLVVKAVCKNIGTRASVASHMRFQIGGESTPPVYDIEPLAPGAKRQWLRGITLDVAQNYRITVTADVNGEVTESNEGNNVKTFDFTVLAPGKADLIIESITTNPVAPHVGDLVSITVNYANVGTATAVTFKTRTIIGGESPAPTPATWHNIRPGHRFSEHRSYTFGSAAGFMLKSRIDLDGEVEESNELNNERQHMLVVAP